MAAALHRIEQRITELVQSAPEADAGVVDDLLEALRAVGSPLALAIARIVELIAEQLVDPGIALPPLAMACATLAGGVRGALGERELEAARYEIETLLPAPSRIDRFRSAAQQGSESPCGEGPPCGTPDPPARVILPQVPLSALRRRPA
jgi:hypothetical protein